MGRKEIKWKGGKWKECYGKGRKVKGREGRKEERRVLERVKEGEHMKWNAGKGEMGY